MQAYMKGVLDDPGRDGTVAFEVETGNVSKPWKCKKRKNY